MQYKRICPSDKIADFMRKLKFPAQIALYKYTSKAKNMGDVREKRGGWLWVK